MDEPKETRLQRRVKNKQDHETVIALQRDQFRKRQRNKHIFNYGIVAVIVIAVRPSAKSQSSLAAPTSPIAIAS